MRGKVYRRISADPIHQDHPRLCGEKYPRHMQSVCCPGSPPPMRGKGGFTSSSVAASGITPAYAGKSSRYLKTKDKK